MERSRRKRLSELYGEPVSQLRTPQTLRQRVQDRQHQNAFKKEALDSKPVVTHHSHNSVKKQLEPIIPTSVIDLSSQRSFIFAVFTILQAYKLYDLILLKSNLPISASLGTPSQQLNFIVKYIFYDTAFLYFLPAFKIPKLTFRFSTVILQIALFISADLFLATEFSFPLTGILVSLWKKINSKDLNILGSSSKIEKYDSKKHFKGSHTIKILPENTAFLNPFAESFCLIEGVSNFKVDVPVRFNSTSDIEFIQLKYTDLETSTPKLLNFTKKDIKKFNYANINKYYERDSFSGPSINYLNIPVSDAGFYEINQVLDAKYLGLRTYRSYLFVPYCPSSYITNVKELNTDKCFGDSDVIKFAVNGVPPLKLKYRKVVNDHVQIFHDQSLQPEFFESPLFGDGESKTFTKDQLANLNWLRSRSVEVELSNSIKQLGNYKYRIEEVVDGLGNFVNFTRDLKNDDSLFRNYELLYSFTAYELPKVQLAEKVDLSSLTRKALYLDIDDRSKDKPPFEATLKYINEDESEVSEFKHVFQNHYDSFRVDKPGTYILENVQSKYCPSIVNGGSAISVSLPVVPKLEIDATPITDSCVGQVGLVFDLSLIGTPPFTLERVIYRVENGERKLEQKKSLVSEGTRHSFSYEPKSEGDYEIIFTSLRDSLYKEPIKLEPSSGFTYKTSMRVKPSAEIKNYRSGRALCLGSKGRIPIEFTGEAPFSLEYDVIETSTNKRTLHSITDINDNFFEFETPSFKVGGEYIISLTSLQDSSGCLVKLTGADAKVTVRREIPRVAFNPSDGNTEIKIREGDIAELPVRLLGEGQFTVDYDYYDPQGIHMGCNKKTLENSRSHLEVSRAGTYVLKSGNDSFCPGAVDEKAKTFKISYYTKPHLEINKHSKVELLGDSVFQKPDVCQHHKDSLDLTLFGAPPFIVEYTSIDPRGYKQTDSLSTSSKYASITLKNDKNGQYVYYINGIYDSVYSKRDLQKIQYSSQRIRIDQYVNSSPNSSFQNKRRSYRTCSLNLRDPNLLEPIFLNFEGNAPYSITFELYHESSSKSDFLTLSNIESPSDLKGLYHGLKFGNHIITIVKIVDSNGCVQEEFADNNYISISITDTPKIHQLESNANYCEGDHVGYQLIGTPPFNIVYSFNGIHLKTVEQSTQFVRFASEPGILSIESLQDSSSNCIVNFTLPENQEFANKLPITIHPIPSVEVSQGDIIIQDIHEGDQAEIIFSFEGTPPFQLTYVRIEDVEIKKGKTKSHVVETHTIKDIYAYEYRVLTSLQGKYEAIKVSDAFCVARNE